MRPTRPTRLAAAAVAAAMLAACSSGDAAEDPTPSETTSTASPTATDTPSPDASTESAPSEDGTESMTVEEAQSIVDATTAVYNDAVIEVLEQQRIGTGFYERLRSIYTDDMVDLYEQLWVQAAGNEFADYNTANPTGVKDRVLSVEVDQDDCFMVGIERDFTGLTADDAEDTLEVENYFIAFVQSTEDGRDGAGTGWIRKWDVTSRSGEPGNLCEEEYGGTAGSGDDA